MFYWKKSWMGGSSVSSAVQLLNRAKIPTFEYPDDAAKTFAAMWIYSKNLQSLYETPAIRENSLEYELNHDNASIAKELIDKARREGRTLLDEFESKQILSLYNIPIVRTEIAVTADEAAVLARDIGYPIVLKLFSKTITHKTDVGGVKLNLRREEDVVKAFKDIEESVSRIVGKEHFHGVTVQKMIKLDGYEVILGSSVDEQFGPVLLFGTGGQLVEVYKDRALALPPLNINLAYKMMEKTKIFEALQGVRGRKAVDLAYLESILVKFSQLIVENRWIKECDINPLLVSDEGIIALDARIVLYDSSVKEVVPLAIRPYPNNYGKDIRLNNGVEMTLRPIRPEDERLVVNFHQALSSETVRQRYFGFISLDERVQHERLIRICFNDFDREIAIVAEIKKPEHEIIGIGRLSVIPGTDNAQLTMTIRDGYHNLSLGSKMLEHLIHIAKEENIQKIYAQILNENEGMIRITKKFGFSIKNDDTFTYAEITL